MAGGKGEGASAASAVCGGGGSGDSRWSHAGPAKRRRRSRARQRSRPLHRPCCFDSHKSTAAGARLAPTVVDGRGRGGGAEGLGKHAGVLRPAARAGVGPPSTTRCLSHPPFPHSLRSPSPSVPFPTTRVGLRCPTRAGQRARASASSFIRRWGLGAHPPPEASP